MLRHRVILSAILVMLLLCSCRTRYVPADVHHYHDTERIVQQADSTHRIDSIVIVQRGDTVLIRERTIHNNYHTIQEVDRSADSVSPPAVDTEMLQAIIDSEVEHRTAPLVARLRLGGVLLGVALLLLIARLVITLIRNKTLWEIK